MKLTDEQVIKMAKLAILSSVPAGLGWLHADPTLTEERIDDLEITYNSLGVDYYQGRMVKFHATKQNNGEWTFGMVHPEYQSWIRKYSTYEALAEAAWNTGQ